MLVLLTALAASVAAWIKRRRRRLLLSRQANQMGLRFWVSDPFNIPGRYGEMAVIAGGHSPVAHNVTYGQMSGLAVRAFDFHCEVGHGASRATQRWGVVLVEMPHPTAGALLLRGACPGLVGRPLRQSPPWMCAGDAAAGAVLAKALSPLEALGDCCIEAHGAALLAALPAAFCAKGYKQALQMLIDAAAALCRWPAENVAISAGEC